MSYKIYKHTSPDGKVYIGQTGQDNLSVRWKNGQGYKNNKSFCDDILYWGWKAFDHEILAEVEDRTEAMLLERMYIKKYSDNCYNQVENKKTLRISLSGTPKYYLPDKNLYFHSYEEIGDYFGGLSKQNISYKIKKGLLKIKTLTEEERIAYKKNHN